nr:hypothetical protein Hi04_10k_c3883_00018 [uncultured bacterium]
MKLSIDTDAKTVVLERDGERRELGLYTAEAFTAISDLWVKQGFALKYSYGFTWMGRPIIQLPEDVVRIQETIYRVKPDVIVETGVAHGGSLIFYASLFRAMGKGRVIGIDIEIRKQNRAAIEAHEMARDITLVEGSSTARVTVERVASMIRANERVLVILDSNHSKQHVLQELQLYAPLVSENSYIIATDGIMQELHDVPFGAPTWGEDNPQAAAREFLRSSSSFVLEQPPFVFGEALSRHQVTHWPNAYLRRLPK